MTSSDPGRPADPDETRLADLEFKLAFLERELEKWKEAVDALHARLERSEAEWRNALRELRGDGAEDPGQPFAAGDSESGS